MNSFCDGRNLRLAVLVYDILENAGAVRNPLACSRFLTAYVHCGIGAGEGVLAGLRGNRGRAANTLQSGHIMLRNGFTLNGPGEGEHGGEHGGEDGGTGTGVVTKTRVETRKPALYKVLLLNDDYTPMEFVVHVLQRFFRMSVEDATRVMLHVHQRGVGICGIFTYEVAETKVTQVMDFAKQHQHPLQCTLEKA